MEWLHVSRKKCGNITSPLTISYFQNRKKYKNCQTLAIPFKAPKVLTANSQQLTANSRRSNLQFPRRLQSLNALVLREKLFQFFSRYLLADDLLLVVKHV